MRSGASEEEIVQIIGAAVSKKKKQHAGTEDFFINSFKIICLYFFRKIYFRIWKKNYLKKN